MIENLPLFGVNVKIWIFLGFIRQKSLRNVISFSIVPLIMNIFEFLNLYHMWGNFESLGLGLFMTSILLNSIVRIFAVSSKQKKFVTFMANVERWYLEAELQHDRHALFILNLSAKRAQFISNFGLTFGLIGSFMTLSFPLLAKERELPYAIWIPGLDVLTSPLYECFYLIEVIFVMPFIIVTYIPFTNLFVSWLIFGIGLLQDLRFKLQNLTRNNYGTEDKLLVALKKCIAYHKRIIDFKTALEELVSFVSLVEFLLFSLMLCVLLFFISVVDRLMLKCTAAIYIFSIFYVIFLTYWHANLFSYESQQIADAAYSVEWTTGNKELKKCIQILIARSQNALTISAGGMYPMNLETFQALLNASYTYLTLLQGFSAKE